MRFKILFLSMILSGIFFAGCSDDGAAVTVLQTELEEVPAEGTILSVDIEAIGAWETESMEPDWCNVYPKNGSGNATIRIDVSGNLSSERTATVMLSSNGHKTEIQVRQAALPENQELHYRIPVVFHVLYKDKNDAKQYILPERIQEVLAEVNNFYAGGVRYSGGEAGQDINVEFYLAEADGEGNVLENPGVQYHEWPEMPIDCEEFMESNAEEEIGIMWDQNRFINIVLYNFAAEAGSQTVTLGISHLAYSAVGSTYLEGLTEVEYSYMDYRQLGYPRCVSVNSLYFDQSSTAERYNSSDVSVTLAHELGHYLGLHHAFNEDEEGKLASDCIDSDYCTDTPPYDRNIYAKIREAIYAEANMMHRPVSFDDLVMRIDCSTGREFVSYNLMDYEVSCSDRFTAQQRNRIRHVLMYSPLIPGPKIGAQTRSSQEKLDLPIVYRK